MLLQEKTVEWRQSSTHFMTLVAVRSRSKLSDMSKLEIIDEISFTVVDVKLTDHMESNKTLIKTLEITN